MSRTFGALLAERRATLAGREDELAALATLLDAGGPLVAVVHGVAGSGKSALLRAFGAEAAERGAAVVAVDGRAVEPTPQGFLAAVEPALAAADGPVVLTVDTAERLRLLDGWLRQTFLPSLPEHARVVLATRDAPGAVWRSSFGELLRAVPLGPLSPAAAAEVLRRAGLDEPQAEWVNRFVRGHPLSLQLAASAIRERPDAPEDAVLPTVVQELAALYLDGLDPATREALDATSVLRRVTLSLLGALLPGEPPQAPFARLAALPFVELGREGLVVHDTVRETVAALLRATDPVRHRAYRAAAWRQIRHELAGAAGAAPLGLARRHDRARRRAARARGVLPVRGPALRGRDRPARATATRSWRSPRGTSRPRRSRSCARGGTRSRARSASRASPRGRVVAFTILCELADVPQRLLMRDPLCGPWRRHLRAQPVPRGQQVLLARSALAHGTGQASVALLRRAAARHRARLARGRPGAAAHLLPRARRRAAHPARAGRLRRAPGLPRGRARRRRRSGRSCATSAPSR